MNRFHAIFILVLVLGLGLMFIACGEENGDEEEDCPSFADYQVYPEVGESDSVFEIYVRLKPKSANQKVVRIYAQLYFSTSQFAGQTFDLVRSETDHLRYLRTFRGNEVCENGTCSLYFKVIAEHSGGCKKAFETDMFQVIIDGGDDDTAGDSDDDIAG